MSDLLVKLYELPPLEDALGAAGRNGVTIRRALAPERSTLSDWVTRTFSRPWADECRVATSRHPLSCFVAVRSGDDGREIMGFACYNATFLGFFGPVGVAEMQRGHGVGKALTLTALHAMKNDGFAYAVIGDAGSSDYYHRICGATVIEDSTPGAYQGMIRGT